MRGPCTTCGLFQRYRPMTQLIARDVGVMEPGLVSELTRLMQDERQKQDAEAEQRLELLRIERLEWPDRPAMSDYCALKETDHSFLLYEVKNADGECDDHDPAQPARRSCATCAFFSPAPGEARKQDMLLRYRQLRETAAGLDQQGDQGLGNYVQAIETEQAFEATQAYYFGRFTVAPPNWLPLCRHFSAEESFIPCAVANPHDRCTAWKPAKPTPAPARRPSVGTAAPAPTGLFAELARKALK
jgi:hypothetical protein